MTAPLPNDARAQLERLYEEMRPKSLYPLWEVLSALVTPAALAGAGLEMGLCLGPRPSAAGG